MPDATTVATLYAAITDALDEVAELQPFTRGEAMTAMVQLLVATGLHDPEDTAERFEAEAIDVLRATIESYQEAHGTLPAH